MGRVSTCQKNCNTIDLRGAQVNDATVLSMSPMRTRKSSGPNTDPRGYPEVTGLGLDFFPSTSTDWTRFVKKENILQFTFSPPEKHFAVHLFATRANISQFTYSPPQKTFSSSPSRHQRNHFAVHLLATRANILRFTYSPPQQTFCSSPIRHQRKHFQVHLPATRENISQFTYSPPDQIFCSSPIRH